MKRCGIVVPYQAHSTYSFNTKELVSAVSENIGNLMFRYATSHILQDYVPIYFDHTSIDEYREKIDLVVYPTANQLNPSITHLGRHALFFEKLDKPVIMLGLGAQSTDDQSSIANRLSSDARRFFNVISGLSYKIGVRGKFTGQMLSEIGIHNWEVMGCPSQFINPRLDLGQVIAKKLERLSSRPETISRVAVFPQHGNAYMTSTHGPSEKALFEYSIKTRGASYIVNGPFQVLAIARGRAYEIPLEQRRRIADFFMPGTELVEFEKSFRGAATVFTTVESLMEHLSQCDFSVGKRIHGAFAAIQSTTPAIVIAHDSRTRELAETTKTPLVNMESLSSSLNIADIVSGIEFDAIEFDKNRLSNYEKMADVFAYCGHRIPELGEVGLH